MFLNEARLAATLQHPNVAAVHDIGVEDGDYFFAMEYVHGEDLDRVASQASEHGVPVSMDAALTLVAGLCAGLHYAHERTGPDGQPLQIVHRDVSPSNVIVSYDGAVKLVDFGIARAMAGKPNTTPGGLKGKIVYMSPEQCKEEAVLDRRSDIYSIGTLLYELTVGRAPFTGESEYAILNQIVNTDVPPPTSHVPGYPPALEKIVLRALARDPAQRYETALQLQGELEDFAHESRLRVSPLVLARLMSTLFPARLEEWDNAKSQGAFFVEQHVVRTLIEDGREPHAAVPHVEVTGLTPVTAPPTPPTRMPTPSPARVATPMPGTVPIMGVATAGTLVSSSASAEPVPAREHARMQTEYVRGPTKSHRGPVFALAGLLVGGGGVAAYVMMRNDSTSTPTAEMVAKPERAAPPAPPPAPAPAAEVAPPAAPAADVAPTPAAKSVEVAAPAPDPTPARPPTSKPHHVHVAKPHPKPVPKPEEKPWNADSPFMPVRTDKH